MQAPTICICTAAARTNINLIWEAMGRGPGTFSRKLCAVDPNATYEEPATHYLMQDMSATDENVAIWSAMAENNDLPPITGTWGEDGVISSQDAQAAISSGNLFVFPAYGLDGEQSELDWRNGVLAGMGLQFVPDEPI